jgi:hypothetical protein
VVSHVNEMLTAEAKRIEDQAALIT